MKKTKGNFAKLQLTKIAVVRLNSQDLNKFAGGATIVDTCDPQSRFCSVLCLTAPTDTAPVWSWNCPK